MVIGDYVILEDEIHNKFVIANLKTFRIVQLNVPDQITAAERVTQWILEKAK